MTRARVTHSLFFLYAILSVSWFQCGSPKTITSQCSRRRLDRAPSSPNLVEHLVSCDADLVSEAELAVFARQIHAKFQLREPPELHYHPLWTGWSLRLHSGASADTDEVYAAILAHTDCHSVQPSVRVQHAPFVTEGIVKDVSTTPTLSNMSWPWGVLRLSKPQLPLPNNYSPAYNGSSVSCFILDSGLDTTHHEFRNGKSHSGIIKTRIVANVFDLFAADPTNPPENNDKVGHGTHVAATIGGMSVGVSPEVNLFGVRVLDAKGGGLDRQILEGLLFVYDWFRASGNPPTVINMSLGGPCGSYSQCASNILVEAVNKLVREGIQVVVAAGNEGCDSCLETPAFAAGAITTGASSQQDHVAYFSDQGKCLDIFAPGINITSACTIALNTACVGDGHYMALSGTSMAAPHVSGVVAQILQVLAQSSTNLSSTHTGNDVDVNTALLCTAAKNVLQLNAHTRYGMSLSRNFLLQVPFVTTSLKGARDFRALSCDLQQGCEQFNYCSDHGICEKGRCLCDATFWGENCSATILSEQCEHASDGSRDSESFFSQYTLFDRTGSGSGWSGAIFDIVALTTGRGDDASVRKNEIVLSTILCAGLNETSGLCIDSGAGNRRYFLEVQADSTGANPYAGWSYCGVTGGAPSRWEVAMGSGSGSVNCSLKCPLPILNITLAVPLGSAGSFTYRLADVAYGRWIASGSWVGSTNVESSVTKTQLVSSSTGEKILTQTHAICIPEFLLSLDQDITISIVTHGDADEEATLAFYGLPPRRITTSFAFVRLKYDEEKRSWTECSFVSNTLRSPADLGLLKFQNVSEERIEFAILNARPLDFAHFYNNASTNTRLLQKESSIVGAGSGAISSSGGVLDTETWHSSKYELVGVDAFAGIVMGNESLTRRGVEGKGTDHLLVALCHMNMSRPSYMNVNEWRLVTKPLKERSSLPTSFPSPPTEGQMLPSAVPTLHPSAFPTQLPTRNYSAYESGEKSNYEQNGASSFWMSCGAYGPISEDAFKFRRLAHNSNSSTAKCERACLDLVATDTPPSTRLQRSTGGSSATSALLSSNLALAMLSLSSTSKLVSLFPLKQTNALCLGNSTNYGQEICYRLVLGGGTLLSRPYFTFCGLNTSVSTTSVVDFCVRDFTTCRAVVVEDASSACLADSDDELAFSASGGTTLNDGEEPVSRGSKPKPPRPTLHNLFVLLFANSGTGWKGASWLLFAAPLSSVFSTPPDPSSQVAEKVDITLFRIAQAYYSVTRPPALSSPTPRRRQEQEQQVVVDDSILDDDFVKKTDRSGFPILDQGTLAPNLQSGYSSLCLEDGCYLFDVTLGSKPREIEFVLCGMIGDAGWQGVLKIVDGKCVLLDSVVSCYKDEIEALAKRVLLFVFWSAAVFALLLIALVSVVCSKPAGVLAETQKEYEYVVLARGAEEEGLEMRETASVVL